MRRRGSTVLLLILAGALDPPADSDHLIDDADSDKLQIDDTTTDDVLENED